MLQEKRAMPEVDEELVVLVVKNYKKEFAMLNSNKHQLWMFPAGKVEKDECMYEAMRREAYEELGIHVHQNSLSLLATEYDYYRKDGNMIMIRVNVFRPISYHGICRNVEHDKHAKMAWMNIDELRSTMRTQRDFTVNDVALKVIY